jgi:glycosyltransferase involved in cell wall biosynthesis
MELSVVIVVYNIPREAPRTLFSLSPVYQQGITADDYEVIVVENGSAKPLDPMQVTQLGSNFRYYYLDNASPSPARALNFGMQKAQGEVIGLMVDGARICTPGLLHHALAGTRMYHRAVVASLGFYLGEGYQRISIRHGYNQREEDYLLEKIGWPRDGYRLFEVGSLDESSHWTGPITESNAIFMRKELWVEMEGIDERFDQPGGGLVNYDTFVRACELPNSELVLLLGEGTFHQLHNGVATNAPIDLHEKNIIRWQKQYLEIRGKDYVTPGKLRRLAGPLPASFLSHLSKEFFGIHLYTASLTIENAKLVAQVQKLGGQVSYGSGKVSKQHEVTKVGIDEEAKVLFNIDRISYGLRDFSVEGWGVFKDRDSKNTQYFIVLTSAEKTYFFDTEPVKRPDVTDAFKKLRNYDDSGYSALIMNDSLEPGIYQVGIYLHQNGVYAQKMSDKYVKIGIAK